MPESSACVRETRRRTSKYLGLRGGGTAAPVCEITGSLAAMALIGRQRLAVARLNEITH